MLKISPKFCRTAERYLMKNTVRAKYNRNMDTALFSGIASVVGVVNFPELSHYGIGALGLAGAIYVRSTALALKNLIKLQPIRWRAIKIKKAIKNTVKP